MNVLLTLCIIVGDNVMVGSPGFHLLVLARIYISMNLLLQVPLAVSLQLTISKHAVAILMHKYQK